MLALAVALVLVAASPAMAAVKGFNDYGYNYTARIFNGPADGVDKTLDGKVWGDPTYANDQLVMKWSAAWDEGNAGNWTADAWCTNHWNGDVPGGSGESEFYKIIWVGPELGNSPLWRDGGYAVWGQFEVIFDRYLPSDHALEWFAKTTPAGLGGK